MQYDGLLSAVAGRRAPGSRRAIPWRILAMLLSLHAIVAAKGGRSPAPRTEATSCSQSKRGRARLDAKLLTRVLGEALEPTSRRKFKIRVVESEGGAAGGVAPEGQGVVAEEVRPAARRRAGTAATRAAAAPPGVAATQPPPPRRRAAARRRAPR